MIGPIISTVLGTDTDVSKFNIYMRQTCSCSLQNVSRQFSKISIICS